MLLTAAVIALLLMGVLAPFETLGWWAGWYGEKLSDNPLQPVFPQTSSKRHYLVFLTGIGGFTPDQHDARETVFLTRLQSILSDVEIVGDIFPYSSSNRALTGQRFFSWAWRWLAGRRGHGPLSYLAFLINVRNLWQVLVSSDARFGLLYNYAAAELILQKLLEHGYPLGSGIPVTILGYSGGGQIALGAAPFIKETINAPTHLISLGGVMCGKMAAPAPNSIPHLYGAHDVTQRLGYLLFPQRWPFLKYTAWNRARQQGQIRRVFMGPMKHTGRRGYLDAEARFEDRSYLEDTIKVITGLLGTSF